jgi:hypothetical protein
MRRLFSSRKTVLFELNEVPYKVLRRFARQQPQSATAQLLSDGQCFSTLAADEGELSPWVTWPTLHRGTTVHGIRDLGQDLSAADAEYPPLWHLLARSGVRVGMFGSMHSYPLPADLSRFAFYLPDTFAAGPEAHPSRLSDFQRFNLAMTAKNGRNVTRGLAGREALAFLRSAPALGLSAASVAKAARQIASERINPARAVRRRSLQAVFAFDFFRAALTRTKPDCAFFFANHVASAQHRYWPAAFPEDYSEQWWSAEWAATYADEIDCAMAETDRMLAWLLRFVRAHGYSLAVLGSMGQTANDWDMTARSQLLLRDPARLMSALGVERWERRPTMEPIYTFALDDPARAARALSTLAICGSPIRVTNDAETLTFELGQMNLVAPAVTLAGRDYGPAELGIENVEVQDEVGSAAGHTAEGAMIVYGAGRSVVETPVSTLEIAPALLKAFGVEPLEHMLRPPYPLRSAA